MAEAQVFTKDSILQALPGLTGKAKIDAYQTLITSNWLNLPDKAMNYAHEAVRYASTQDDVTLKAIAIRLLGGVFLYKGSYDSALRYSKEAYQLSLETGDSTLISSGLNNIGFTHYHFGNYPQALENLLKSLKIKLEIHQEYGLGQTLNNLGLVYTRLKDFEKARTYFYDALLVANRLHDKNIELYSTNNIGFTYLEEDNLSSAKNYFKQSLEIARGVDNANWHATAYSGMAQVVMREGDERSAEYYFDKSLELRNSIGDKRGISEIYYFLSELRLETGSYESALSYFRKSQQIATDAKMKQRILENYQLAREIFEKQGWFDSALYYQVRFTQLRDSLFNENMARELVDIQLSMQEEETKRKLASKDEELNRKTTITNFLTIIFLLTLLFSFAFYRSYKLQKELSKSLRRSNEELSEKSEKIQQQKESLVLSNAELHDARERIHVQNLQLEELNRHLQSTVDLRTKELDVASRELRIVSLELDNFIYKSSHDIKGPLVRLLGICHVALLDIQDEKAREYISMLYESARHLNDIFDRLKAVSDINAASLTHEPIDFSIVVEKVTEELKTMEGFNSIELFSEIDPTLKYESDPFLLQTIFHNMLENAIRFQRKSEVQKKFIAIRVEVKNLNVVLSFIDNGIGIKEHAMEDIFKMFSKAALEHHNVGLGLYIVKQCVNKLEGTIRLAKNTKGYTEFQITLPWKESVREFA